MIKDSKDREIKTLNKKLSNATEKLETQLKKTLELEKDIRDNYEPQGRNGIVLESTNVSNRMNSKYLTMLCSERGTSGT